MERIEQTLIYSIDVSCKSEFIYIEQVGDEAGYTDSVLIEKSSLPALIAALQKYVE